MVMQESKSTVLHIIDWLSAIRRVPSVTGAHTKLQKTPSLYITPGYTVE